MANEVNNEIDPFKEEDRKEKEFTNHVSQLRNTEDFGGTSDLTNSTQDISFEEIAGQTPHENFNFLSHVDLDRELPDKGIGREAIDLVTQGGKVTAGSAGLVAHGVTRGTQNVWNGLRALAIEQGLTEDAPLGMGELIKEDYDMNVDLDPWEWLNMDLTEGEKTVATVGAQLPLMFTLGSKLASIPKIAQGLKSGSFLSKSASLLAVETGSVVGSHALIADTTKGSVLEWLGVEEDDAFGYFLDTEGDTVMETRVKNALEDLGMGGLLGEVMTGFSSVKKTIQGSSKNEGMKLALTRELFEGVRTDYTRNFINKNFKASSLMADSHLSYVDTPFMIKKPRASYRQQEVDILKDKLKNLTGRRKEHRRKQLEMRIKQAEDLYRRDQYRDALKLNLKVGEAVFDTTMDVIGDVNKLTNKSEAVLKRRIAKVKHKNSMNKELDEVNEALDNGKLTESQSLLAREVLDRYRHGSVTEDTLRNNPRVTSTGDEAIDGAVNLASFFGAKAGFAKSTKTIMDNIKYIDDVMTNGRSDAFTDALEVLSKNTGLDKKSLMVNASAWGTVLAESAPLVLAIGRHRNEAITQLLDTAKRLDNQFKDITKGSISEKDLSDLLAVAKTFDTLDSGLSGIGTGHARGLRAFGDLGRDYTADVWDEVMSNHKLPKAGKDLSKREKLLMSDMVANLSTADQKGLQQFVRKLAKAKPSDLTTKGAKKLMEGHAFHELVIANGVGGMIAKLSTLGGVLLGTAVQFAWKQGVTANMEIAINYALRAWNGTDSGARFAENLHRVDGLVDVWKDYARSLFDPEFTLKGRIGSQGLEYSNNLTHKSWQELKDILRDTASTTKHGIKNKEGVTLVEARPKTAWLQKHMGRPLAFSLMANNMSIKGMEAMDNLFRRMVIQAENSAYASRVWHRSGGASFFGENVTKADFMDRFRQLSDEYLDLDEMMTAGKVSREEGLIKAEKMFELHPDLLPIVQQNVQRSTRIGVETTLQEMTSDHAMGRVLTTMNQLASDNVTAKTLMAMILPFQKSPVNALRSALEHTPAGYFASRRLHDMMTKGTLDEQIEAWARVVSGTSLMASVYAMALEGKISGTITKDNFGEMHSKGVPNRSWLVGDQWVSYEKMGIFAPLVAAIADLSTLKSDDIEASNANILHMAMENVLVDGHFGMTQDFMDAVTSDDPTKVTQFLAERAVTVLATPANGVVSTLGDIVHEERVTSTIDRNVMGFYDNFKRVMGNSMRNHVLGQLAQTDFVDEHLDIYDTKLDVVGAPTMKYSNTLAGKTASILGVRTRDVNTSRAMSELRKHGLIPKSNSPTKIDGVTLSGADHNKYQQSLWQGAEGMLEEVKHIVDTKHYNDMKSGAQHILLSRIKESHTKRAKGMAMHGVEGLRDKVMEHKREESKEALSNADTSGMDDISLYEYSIAGKHLRERKLKEAKQTAEAFNLSK